MRLFLTRFEYSDSPMLCLSIDLDINYLFIFLSQNPMSSIDLLKEFNFLVFIDCTWRVVPMYIYDYLVLIFVALRKTIDGKV